MTTTEIVVCILFSVLLIGIIAVGVFYVRLLKNARQESFDNQKYVKAHRMDFGAINRGTSMDGQAIYSVAPSDMGL